MHHPNSNKGRSPELLQDVELQVMPSSSSTASATNSTQQSIPINLQPPATQTEWPSLFPRAASRQPVASELFASAASASTSLQVLSNPSLSGIQFHSPHHGQSELVASSSHLGHPDSSSSPPPDDTNTPTSGRCCTPENESKKHAHVLRSFDALLGAHMSLQQEKQQQQLQQQQQQLTQVTQLYLFPLERPAGIQGLPDELIGVIFGYLLSKKDWKIWSTYLSTRPALSLVCRQWASVVSGLRDSFLLAESKISDFIEADCKDFGTGLDVTGLSLSNQECLERVLKHALAAPTGNSNTAASSEKAPASASQTDTTPMAIIHQHNTSAIEDLNPTRASARAAAAAAVQAQSNTAKASKASSVLASVSSICSLFRSSSPTISNETTLFAALCLPHLKHLKLHDIVLSNSLHPAADCLRAVMDFSPNLQTLQLVRVQDLGSLSFKHTTLNTLILKECNVLSSWKAETPNLRELEIHLCSRVGDRFSGEMSTAVSNCLRKMSIHGHGHFRSPCFKLENLKKIDLTFDNARDVTDLTLSCPNLTSLCLQYRGGNSMGLCFAECTRLTTMRMVFHASDNPITDKWIASSLTNILKRHTSLESLTLEGCKKLEAPSLICRYLKKITMIGLESLESLSFSAPKDAQKPDTETEGASPTDSEMKIDDTDAAEEKDEEVGLFPRVVFARCSDRFVQECLPMLRAADPKRIVHYIGPTDPVT